MVLEGYYGESDDESAVLTLLHAMESGMMIDSPQMLMEAIATTPTPPYYAVIFTSLRTRIGRWLYRHGKADGINLQKNSPAF
jgi:hypothetical protein